MKFRTEIEYSKSSFKISHDDGIVLLGSCFSDNIGERLKSECFNVVHNPMGPLYNPVSLARLITDLLEERVYSATDFLKDSAAAWHCLDFASRYQHADRDSLAEVLNSDMAKLRNAFVRADILAVTFGSSVVYSVNGSIDGTVGNCHKFHSSMFTRMTVDVDAIVSLWRPLLMRLADKGKNVIFTVSPIRHLADGLHGNELSKARLLLACEALGDMSEYFPAYEIMMDDLRDYRFYERDLKHPSEMACDYIYERFGERYFSEETKRRCVQFRDENRRAQHRQIIK